MKLGILADSHDHVRNIRRALDIFREREVEAVIHAGDVVAPFAAKALAEFVKDTGGPVYAVYGNNDGERVGLASVLDIVPPPRGLRLAERTVIVAHEPGEIPEWMKKAADVIVTGHTHEVVVPRCPAQSEGPDAAPPTEAEKERQTPLWINPGESGGWLGGRATCVVLDLESMKAELCEIGGP